MKARITVTDGQGNVYEGDVHLKQVSATKTRSTKDDSSREADTYRNFKFPNWFYGAKDRMSNADAVALALYETNASLTSGQLAVLLSRAWKDIHLKNVSKVLTTRGKHLFPYVEKDSGGYRLNELGKKWVEKEVITKYRTAESNP